MRIGRDLPGGAQNPSSRTAFLHAPPRPSVAPEGMPAWPARCRCCRRSGWRSSATTTPASARGSGTCPARRSATPTVSTWPPIRSAPPRPPGRTSKPPPARSWCTSTLTRSIRPACRVLSLFDPKSQLVKLSGDLVQGLRDRAAGLSRVGRTERLAAAHAVIVLLAYFETVREVSLPFDLGELSLTRAEQVSLAGGEAPADGRAGAVAAALLRAELPMPAPQRPYELTLQALDDFYAYLSQQVTRTRRAPGWITWPSPSRTARNSTPGRRGWRRPLSADQCLTALRLRLVLPVVAMLAPGLARYPGRVVLSCRFRQAEIGAGVGPAQDAEQYDDALEGRHGDCQGREEEDAGDQRPGARGAGRQESRCGGQEQPGSCEQAPRCAIG